MSTVTEYGHEWDARVPRADIDWYIGRLHVSTTGDVIAADIRKRCTAPGYTAELVNQAVAYALIVHERNCALYNRVTRGAL